MREPLHADSDCLFSTRTRRVLGSHACQVLPRHLMSKRRRPSPLRENILEELRAGFGHQAPSPSTRETGDVSLTSYSSGYITATMSFRQDPPHNNPTNPTVVVIVLFKIDPPADTDPKDRFIISASIVSIADYNIRQKLG